VKNSPTASAISIRKVSGKKKSRFLPGLNPILSIKPLGEPGGNIDRRPEMNKEENIKREIGKTIEYLNVIQLELEGIKYLIALYLLKLGATQTEVAAAIGVDQSTISRKFPSKIKLFNKKG
jgi:DNA-directed RNA polymerase specialized sigma subunit